MEENRLIVGEIEEDAFVLTQFKHMNTQSVISKERLEAICDYLLKILENGEQENFITLNDQLPVRVNHAEMEEMLAIFMNIRGMLN
ncbi:hypothetical protein [Bacillus timonensis]|uniref:hypothetical protein n=1 Tax=Bacillus timonensis TaxID=1033734 RepID=UPI000287AA24|nr:hypothetical protein [Bacillus timonensis]